MEELEGVSLRSGPSALVSAHPIVELHNVLERDLLSFSLSLSRYLVSRLQNVNGTTFIPYKHYENYFQNMAQGSVPLTLVSNNATASGKRWRLRSQACETGASDVNSREPGQRILCSYRKPRAPRNENSVRRQSSTSRALEGQIARPTYLIPASFPPVKRRPASLWWY